MSNNNNRNVGDAPWYHVLISTGLYTGYVPFAPGTAGAFLALLIWIGLYFVLSPMCLCIATIGLIVGCFFVGVWTDNVMERYLGEDPRMVVIDEFFGTWIACLAALFYDGGHWGAVILAFIGFALFRIIDIFKPLGCRWVDKHIRGGLGCMLDDALAGFYAIIITLAIRFLVFPMLTLTPTQKQWVTDAVDSYGEAIEVSVSQAVSVADDNEYDYISIMEKEGLVVYCPNYSKINLVCGTRPTGKESHVLMACEAAFTGELLNDFKHSNIAGNHTSDGQFYKGYSCKANTGCFAWYGDKNEWTFAMNDYNKYVVAASKRKGMAFGQVMVIHNGKLQSKKPQKESSVNYYRVLAELDGKLCIIDSKDKMQYAKFEQALLGMKVKHALYMDMGTGWNYSFYRDNDDKVHYIHAQATKYATNWIVFEK